MNLVTLLKRISNLTHNFFEAQLLKVSLSVPRLNILIYEIVLPEYWVLESSAPLRGGFFRAHQWLCRTNEHTDGRTTGLKELDKVKSVFSRFNFCVSYLGTIQLQGECKANYFSNILNHWFFRFNQCMKCSLQN